MCSKPASCYKPVRITALTLHGIGSYLKGARLDIRPLTILCGANGSGKSTWINVLNLLKESSDEGILPFDVVDSQRHKTLYTHAYLRLFSPSSEDDDASRQVLGECGDAAADREYGPIGCIGLELEAMGHVTLPAIEGEKDISPCADPASTDLLVKGICGAGMGIRIRLVVPGISPYEEGLIELAIRLRPSEPYLPVILLRKDPSAKHYDCYMYESVSVPVRVAEVRPSRKSNSFEVDPIRAKSADSFDRGLCWTGIQRIRQILRLAFEGYFYLGAVRKIVSREEYERSLVNDPSADCVVSRYVGRDGADAHMVYYNFCLNAMLQERPPFTGYLRRPRMWKMTDVPHWRDAMRETPDLKLASILRLGGADALEDLYGKELIERFRGVLNEPKVRALLADKGFLSSLSAEARFLLAQAPEAIHDFDMERLLFAMAQELKYDRDLDTAAYVLETFYAFWMKFLLETWPATESVYHADSLGDYWVGKTKPRGFLADVAPAPSISGRTVQRGDGARYNHPCFNYSSNYATADLLSAGFHQIAPIVIQCGVMRGNELLCVENPEVHLHPSLQTRLTEFLVSEASSGKNLIVETHSDLVIYRVMRAILDEALPQEAVRIYFSEIEKVGDTAQSVLTPIPIDDRGRIAQWPRGFMDEELAEFARLLNARGEELDEDFPE